MNKYYNLRCTDIYLDIKVQEAFGVVRPCWFVQTEYSYVFDYFYNSMVGMSGKIKSVWC